MKATSKVKSKDLLRYGVILKVNTFETSRGIYTIHLIKYENNIFFHKMKDGNLVELKNLSKGENKDNGKQRFRCS